MPQVKLLSSRLWLSATTLTYAEVSANMSVSMFVYVSTDGVALPWVATQSTIDVGALTNGLLQSQHYLWNTRVPEHVHGIACSRLGRWDCVATDDDAVDRRIESLEGIPEANNIHKMRHVSWREPHWHLEAARHGIQIKGRIRRFRFELWRRSCPWAGNTPDVSCVRATPGVWCHADILRQYRWPAISAMVHGSCRREHRWRPCCCIRHIPV